MVYAVFFSTVMYIYGMLAAAGFARIIHIDFDHPFPLVLVQLREPIQRQQEVLPYLRRRSLSGIVLHGLLIVRY